MKPLNILLADDAKSVGKFVSEYLHSAGDQVTYVESMTLDIRIRSMMRIAALQRSSAAVIDNVIEGAVALA